jgi:hypothetical protein
MINLALERLKYLPLPQQLQQRCKRSAIKGRNETFFDK